MEREHTSVLLEETLASLKVAPGDVVVDATLGGAGHFRRLLAALGEGGVIVGIDADPEAVDRAREAYAEDRRPERPVAHLVNDNFRNLTRILERLGVARADAILFDLGWSGFQMASPRGFSFARREEPLLMTYGAEHSETAADIVNSAPEDTLADILARYGEERFARAIARAIVAKRSKERLLTVGQLVDAVALATPAWYQKRRLHPATKTFQALRIAANDELGALSEGLAGALKLLAPGGRLAVITFHSIEDRVVKQRLREAASALEGTASKKPIVPTRAEISRNRRARSAKLRVFVRASTFAGTSVDSAMPLMSYV